jgi:hypothetical protein
MIAKFTKKVVLLTVIVVFNGTSILSQTVTQKFYKDSYLYKEVEESKAKFSLKLIKNEDGSVTHEVLDLKNR